METRDNNLIFKSVHPGEILGEELRERGISSKDFAASLGMQPSHLSELIHGRRDMSPAAAAKIAAALGTSAKSWMNLQRQYEADTEALEQVSTTDAETLAELQAYDELLDLRTLRRRCHVTLRRPAALLACLRDTLRLPPVQELMPRTAGLFRKSAKTGADPRMILTWVTLAQHSAQAKTISGTFRTADCTALAAALSKLFHRNRDVVAQTEQLLANYGIGFVVEEKVDRASIDAYSFQMDGQPFIAVTLRSKKIDHFAFSVMHELGHIAAGDTGNLEQLITDYDKESTKEKAADHFASNALISDSEWTQLPKVPMKPYMIQKVYTAWAHAHDYNEWIVLGKIGYLTGMWKFTDNGSRNIG